MSLSGLKRAATSDPESIEAEDEQLDTVHKRQNKNKLAQARYRQRQREKMDKLDTDVVKLREQVDQLQEALDKSEQENCQMRSALNHRHCEKCAAAQQNPVGEQGENGKAGAPELTSNEWITAMSAHVKGVLSRTRPSQSFDLDSHNPKQWYLCYRTYVTEIAKLLKTVNDPDITSNTQQHQAAVRMDAILTERRGVMGRFHESITRKSLEHKNAIRSQPVQMFGAPPAAMWTKVVAAGQLSNSQRQAILRHRGPYLAQLEAAGVKRRNIMADLAYSDKAQHSNLSTASEALVACRALEDQIMEQQNIDYKFMRAIQVIVTPIQEARMLVAVFPYFMDVAPMVHALAAETVGDLSVLGDPEAESAADDPSAQSDEQPWAQQQRQLPPSSSSEATLFSGFQLPASPFMHAMPQASSRQQRRSGQRQHQQQEQQPLEQQQQQQQQSLRDWSIPQLTTGAFLGSEQSRQPLSQSTEALSLPRLSELMNFDQDPLPDLPLVAPLTENVISLPDVPMHVHHM